MGKEEDARAHSGAHSDWTYKEILQYSTRQHGYILKTNIAWFHLHEVSKNQTHKSKKKRKKNGGDKQ